MSSASAVPTGRPSSSPARRPGRRAPLVARCVCWTGLVLPAGIIQTREPGAVADDPLTAVALVRGVTPAVCLLVALLITRTTLRPVGPREWAAAGYLSVVLASAAWSLAPTLTMLKAAHLICAYALLFVLARCWRDRRQALGDLTWVATTIVLLCGAAALVRPAAAFDGSPARLRGVFPALDPFVLGMVASVAVLLLAGGAGVALLGRPGVRAACLAVAAVVALLTRTRAVVPLVLLGLLLLLCLEGRRRLVAGGAASLAVLAGVLALAPAGPALWSRFMRGKDPSTLLALNGRLPMWQDAVDVTAERPIQGFGYFAGHRFGPYAELYEARAGYASPPYIDGTWAETLLDLGALGVLTLALFVGLGLHAAWRRLDRRDRTACLHVALTSLLVLYSVLDFTVQQVGIPMALLGGLLLAPAAPRPQATGSPSGPTAARRSVEAASRRL